MQKVEGSSPFIRSSRKPCSRGAFVVSGTGRGARTARPARAGRSLELRGDSVAQKRRQSTYSKLSAANANGSNAPAGGSCSITY